MFLRMCAADNSARFPASVRWSPPPPWPPSATERPSAGDATSPPGWASYPAVLHRGKRRLYGISKRATFLFDFRQGFTNWT
jgi:hypothetical protein